MSKNLTNFKCNFANCNKIYSSKYNLSRHIESNHSKHKRFRCRICGKCLSSKQNLQEHRYTHSKVKPYICSVPLCGKTFRQSSQLSNHRKLHKEILLVTQRQREFKELKVKGMQLTSILDTVNQDYAKDFSESNMDYSPLPRITTPQTQVVLPIFPGLPIRTSLGSV